MFVELLLIFIALLCVYEYLTKYGRVGQYVNKIPGPFAWPIIGAIPDLGPPSLLTTGKKIIILFVPIILSLL